MTTFSERFEHLQRALLEVETTLGLLETLLPENFQSERARLVEAYGSGQAALPHFRFGRAEERRRRAGKAATVLSAARILLADSSPESERFRSLTLLFQGRVDELELESRMLLECGTRSFAGLARRRFGLTEEELSGGRDLAARWSEAIATSDPETEDRLLASVFEEKRRNLKLVGEKFLVAERDLASFCAVGGRHLYVRRGARVSSSEAERLWVHEVEGHLLPRLRAREAPAPFAIGTAGCTVDEEGWAVWLEEQEGVLGASRKRELALRFELALAFLLGGEGRLLEQVEVTLDRGTEPGGLASTVCRILRGGGLARESIYLPGYLRVQRALELDPSRARYFRMGRVSVAALPTLSSLFSP